MFEIMLPDLKKTAKGQYHRGRKLKIRPHLGVFLLQQFYNRTDRQIEYDVKENALFQLFCGKGIMLNWHCADHTKIEQFRSRIVPDNQRKLANLIASHAAKMGFADPKHCDVDSTIQSANISRPSKAAMLTKIARAAKKVAVFLEEKILSPMDIISSGLSCFNLKNIKGICKEYIFTKKKLEPSEIKEKIKILFQAVMDPVATVIKVSEGFWDFQKDKSLQPQETLEKLANRRAGIEPLIGHIKRGGQLGRSSMKKDESTKAAGYTAALGFSFNFRQTKNYLTGKHKTQNGVVRFLLEAIRFG